MVLANKIETIVWTKRETGRGEKREETGELESGDRKGCPGNGRPFGLGRL